MAKDALVESAQAFKVGLLEFLTTRGMGVAAELLKTPVWIFLVPGTRAGIHAGGNDRGGTVEALHCLAVYPRLSTHNNTACCNNSNAFSSSNRPVRALPASVLISASAIGSIP